MRPELFEARVVRHERSGRGRIEMNRATLSWVGRTFTVASLAAPLLATYLYFGACGPRKHGVVVSARVFGVSIQAAWCSSGGA